MEDNASHWFIENNSPFEAHMRGYTKVLASDRSKYQTLSIIHSPLYGKCLLLDNKTQSTQFDEHIYHECLVHPVMITHPEPKNVLIIGGGEGATLREVLKHRTVKKGVMLDIDRKVVEFSKKYLPEWPAGAFNDRRSRVIIGDGRKYIQTTREKYDVIIIDISEPIEAGPSYKLFTREFYTMVKKKLTSRGVISLQAGTTSCVEWKFYTHLNATLRKVFPNVAMYQAFIPSFDMPWGFGSASLSGVPSQLGVSEVDSRIRSRIKGELKFYDGVAHQGIFSLPKELRKALFFQKDIISDHHPIFTIA